MFLRFVCPLVLAAMAVFPAAAQIGASVWTQVQVPASMSSWPFSETRYLRVPAGFGIRVIARESDARFLALAPNGDLFLSRPGGGRVMLIRQVPNSDPQYFTWVSGLRRPHDIVFHTIGATTWVYVSEADKISRFPYVPGATTASGREIVVSGLPSSSLPELQGRYGHELKNIALRGEQLYVSIASASNADPDDAVANPFRGSIWVYPAAGGPGREFARGIRNGEGVAFQPGTDRLWVAVNNRDNIRYPFRDQTGWYGQVVPSYVDNHPPDEFIQVRDGGNYGWPFCNPNPDMPNKLLFMPFDFDVETNEDNRVVDCATLDRVTRGIQAHSAPLGFSFTHLTGVPAPYNNGAAIALHGSWNRQQRTGYKVVYLPFGYGIPLFQVDLVNGWLNPFTQDVWGRPVDVITDGANGFYITDDQASAVYHLAPVPGAKVE